MRIAICTAFWGRLPLANVWWAGATRLRQLAERRGHSLEIWAAGDELHHRKLCARYGGRWVEAGNSPLGAKWNKLTKAAWQRGSADYIMILGSDDFLGDYTFLAMLAGAEGVQPHVGLRGIYFLNQPTREVALWRGYPPSDSKYGQPVGAGRMIQADLLDKLDGQPWDNARMSGLDGSFIRNVQPPMAWLVEVGPSRVALDVKYSANIWPFAHLVQSLDLEPAWAGEIGRQIPEWNALLRLKADPHPKEVWSPPAIRRRTLTYDQLVAEGLTPQAPQEAVNATS